MTIFAFIAGIGIPTGIGWLLLSILEGKTPVLFRIERLSMGFLLGITLSMFLAFLLHVTLGVALTRWGVLVPQLMLLGTLLILHFSQSHFSLSHISLPHFSLPRFPLFPSLLIALLAIWTSLRILTAATLLLSSPAYFDDVLSNWNMRGKIFFVEQELQLAIPLGNDQISSAGVSSYPPTVPLLKTYLATLRGQWSEPLANAPHILWYLACLALVFAALARRLPIGWALLGTYMLASLPLFLMHGAVAYADAFLAAHILAAVLPLYSAASAFSVAKIHESPFPVAKIHESSLRNAQSAAFLRIGALATALLIFTKNEALILYLPPLLVILVFACVKMRQLRRLIPYAILLLLVLTPWLLYKWTNGLPFGNAKGIADQVLSWQPGVLLSIIINTFFEGNWIVLLPLFFLCVGVRWKAAFLTPLGICTAFVLIIYVGQILIFLFTGLSTEVLRQTGYARGLVQIAPLICFITTMLLHDIWKEARAS